MDRFAEDRGLNPLNPETWYGISQEQVAAVKVIYYFAFILIDYYQGGSSSIGIQWRVYQYFIASLSGYRLGDK